MMRSQVPLVRLDLIKPFTEELARRGADIDDVMGKLGWSTDLLERSEIWVAAQAVYKFAEYAAEAAGDRFFLRQRRLCSLHPRLATNDRRS